jgi:hypothetical protein
MSLAFKLCAQPSNLIPRIPQVTPGRRELGCEDRVGFSKAHQPVE